MTGLTLNGIAWGRYSSSARSSQADIAQANQTVRKLNLTSLICYGVAGAAGAAWGWLAWRQDRALELDSASLGNETAFVLSYGQRF